MKLYLAGPMTGLPQFNFPEFNRIARELRESGHEVLSPAELHDEKANDYATNSADGLHPGGAYGWELLLKDIETFLGFNPDGIVLMPGWAKSRGARLEAMAALLIFEGIQFLRWNDNTNMAVPIARRAVENALHDAWGYYR